jgi:hypothetical protein
MSDVTVSVLRLHFYETEPTCRNEFYVECHPNPKNLNEAMIYVGSQSGFTKERVCGILLQQSCHTVSHGNGKLLYRGTCASLKNSLKRVLENQEPPQIILE